MSKLDEFLNLTDVSDIRETVIEVINDNKYEFVIRPLTQEEHSEFQKRSTITGRNVSFDIGKYNMLMIESCLIEPDFSNADFLKKAKCISAKEFIAKKFPAGVISDLAAKIQTLSGFETLDVEVEKAKN